MVTANSSPARAWGPGARLLGTGHHQPERVVDNAEIARLVDTTDEWITQRVGIRTRRLAGPDDTVASIATLAAARALDDAGVAPEDIDLVVVATFSNIDRSPSTAGRVAEGIGSSTAAAFDVNSACSGFVQSLAIAQQAIAAGTARTAVVVGAELMSDITDWTDRSTCILVGDGAGAVVLGAAEQSEMSPVVWGSVPGLADSVRVERPERTFRQNGRAVFRWAITEAAGHARRAIERAGLSPEDIAVFVPHQANLRIVEPLAQQLGVVNAIVATDVVESGNTSGASIPLALSKLLATHDVPSGAPILLFGFGGGFAYAGQVVLAP
ncbi:beta-ketoacyl-ACP synthase 3 [Mycetocola reblochoni]|uniref:3-oxoacyl-[acyl-carrier-protein] synthase, KASIII n=2 Tax=Mycetocola reblochoni TaxID=331618 RepID=A0A1R4IWF0_9MICO|nr:beta-ketoacyl-ACP synthase 3 [Mycetocola reblochoni]RLP70955.1 beta-ketoacyl-ACP synthase III [Mycetocola reblochoni]SJN24221.1 3-oxoacyl-[acyl-carrier-protein] synthase, KASIII [Mycetocola reblochoni REB411]